MARRGTEAFPDLGAHCDDPGCNQLDFLPFECDGCGKVFCMEHRTYRDHGCAKAADQGRTVLICVACGVAIERTPGQDDRAVLDAHARSRRCDPAKKHKPRCPARRCKETLTFSNTSHCKTCGLKVCLKHRFPTDHDCSATARRDAGQCARDAKKKDGSRITMPPPVRIFKMF
jgi:predicted nucleic acid binding AN1-type Zn finger protein